MATALEVLPLARAKRELSIPASAGDDDTLLTDQIGSSVDFASRVAGLDVAAMDADDIPPSFIAGCIALLRLLYDGIQNWRPLNAIWALLAPHRTLAVGIISLDDDEEEA